MKRQSSKRYLSLGLAILCSIAVSGTAEAATVVGQVITAEARVDGVPVPSGSTLLSDSVVSSATAPVAVRLRGGQVLGIGENSSARFEDGVLGGVQVAVLTGSVGYEEAVGETVELAQGDSAILDQGEGEVGVGEAVDPDEEVVLCHLKEWTPEKVKICKQDPDTLSGDALEEWRDECKFSRIKVEWRYVPEHLAHADFFADKDRRTEEMPDELECGRKAALWWLTSLLAIPILEDDDGRAPAALSPFIP